MKRLSFVLSCLFVLSQLQIHAASPVVISEFMASNTRTLTNVVLTMDWIEIQNVSSEPVNLLDWSLTGNAGQPGKWRVPAANIIPGRFLIVWASTTFATVPAPLSGGGF